jgi:hypothetical protein
VTVALPELLIVNVCGLLVPAITLPKVKLVALGTNVPVAPEPGVVGVEAEPATPTQPVMDRTARVAVIKASMPKDGRLS